MNKHPSRDHQNLINRDINKREQDINFVRRFSSKYNEDEELVYMPPKRTYKFYQICSFVNPRTRMYDIRVVHFNELSEVVKQSEYMCDKRHCNMIIKSAQHNRYKIYSTNDIDLVDLPDADDLFKGQSSLLN